jgi:medium-chain acyl-[acyl-carrier-protein] hydrolase
MQTRQECTSDAWIVRWSAGAESPAWRLFCFPYAGGGASKYRQWRSALPAKAELCAIQLPGREQRAGEPALRRMEDAVDALVHALAPYIDRPFVFFGHSMGAVIAYEVAKALYLRFGRQPQGLVVSSHRAPHMPSRTRSLHDLPESELIDEIRALQGTPPEILESKELLELLLPTLRSDLELAETYAAKPDDTLSCPVIAAGGDCDPEISPEELDGWRVFTRGPFRRQLFPGDHFYIHDQKSNFLSAMKSQLEILAMSGGCMQHG